MSSSTSTAARCTTTPSPERAERPPLAEEAPPRSSSQRATSSAVRGSDLLLGPFGRVMAANFAFFMNFASFFLLPLFVKELGGRESTVGWVMGSAGVATLASLPLVGMRIDRLSRRRLFLFGAANMTLAACAFAWVDEIGWPLFALRLWQGVSFAAAFTASTTLAAELAPVAVRGRALGWFGVSTLLTHALAPALGEEVLHRWGFSTLFFLAAACSLIALVLIRGVPEHRTVAVAASGQGSLQRIHFLLGLAVVFFGMGFGVVTTYAASFVQSQQLGRVGVFFSAYTAMAIAVRIVAGGLSDRFGRLAVAVPALIALGVSVAGLATVHSSSGLLLAGALFGLAQGIAYPTMHAFLVDVTSAAVLGRAQALFNGAFNFGVMSAALAFGPVADRFGPRVMFAVAAFCPWFAAALFPAASRARKSGGPA